MTAEQSYRDALQYLLSLPDWERGTGARIADESLLLERPRALLSRLDNPQSHYRTILVAGTKGKGSTAAMLESILRAAGFKTGLYTSPHLHTYRERIRANGEMIPMDSFARGVGEIRRHIIALQNESPALESFTTFEAMTALALYFFAEQNVGAAILEVGLGGRLDATNVVQADLALITPISFDHTAVLGDTLPKIAAEKAGIIKPGRPILTAPQAPDALEVIERTAQTRSSPVGVGARDWQWGGDSADLMVQALPRAGLWRDQWRIDRLTLPLLGAHQLTNAALAVAAAQHVRAFWNWNITPDAVRAGLAATRWAGRLEILQRQDAARPWIIADGAHNGDSMAKLVAALKQNFPFGRLLIILGALRDKDLDALAAPLVGETTTVWAIETTHPRSRPAADTAAQLRQRGMDAIPLASMTEALAQARAEASPRDLICITGSLTAVAAVRAVWSLAESPDPPL